MLLRRALLLATVGFGAVSLAACGDDDGPVGGGSEGAFCAQARSLQELEGAALTDEETFDEARAALESAPGAIRDDAQVLIDGLDAIEAGDFEALDDEQDELEEASDNIVAFVKEECGFDIEESTEST